jgi:endonuclease IV
LHPDAITDFGMWRELGSAICIENMDKRKPIGRTARELESVFKELPEATFCFDIGHARQLDLTMTEAYMILRAFGSKLRQVHVSEVNSRSKHGPLSYSSMLAFREVAHLIPAGVPLILETPIGEEAMESEIAKVRDAIPIDLQTMVA